MNLGPWIHSSLFDHLSHHPCQKFWSWSFRNFTIPKDVLFNSLLLYCPISFLGNCRFFENIFKTSFMTLSTLSCVQRHSYYRCFAISQKSTMSAPVWQIAFWTFKQVKIAREECVPLIIVLLFNKRIFKLNRTWKSFCKMSFAAHWSEYTILSQ